MTRKEASPGSSEDHAHQRDPLTQQGVWLWRPRGAGGEPISWVVVAAPFAVAPGDLPSSECCTIRTTQAAAQGQRDAQCYQRTWPSPGVVACSPWLPSSSASRVSNLSTVGSHAPIYTQMHSTLSLANRVSTWRKSLLRPSRFISSCCHTPLPRSSPGCAGHRSVDPHGGGIAQQTPGCPTAPGPSAGDIPAAPHTPQAQGKEYWVPVRGLPFPHLVPALTHPTHAHSLAHSTTPMQIHALTFTHTHTRKFPRHSHMLAHSYCHTHSHSHSHVCAHTPL